MPEVPGRGPRVVWGNAHWCHHREGLEWGSRMQWSFMGQTGRKICRKMSKSALARAPQLPQEVSPGTGLRSLTDALLSLSSSSPPWPPWSSTTRSIPYRSWTDRAAAGSSPACSSPPSPDATAHVRPHLWPHSLPLGLSPSPLPVFHTPPSRLPILCPSPSRPLGRMAQRQKVSPSPHSILIQSLELLLCSPLHWEAGDRQGPGLQPPGMASQAALNEALLGEAEPHGRVWAVLLEHKENPPAFYKRFNRELASGRDLMALHIVLLSINIC